MEGQDLELLLGVLACPRCQTPSLAVSGTASSTQLACQSCRERYPIVDGIPLLLAPEDRERALRGSQPWDRFARVQAADDMSIRARLRPHHFVRLMETEAAHCAAALPEDAWLVDLGAGWAWPWRTVRRPRILAMDTSLDALRLARTWLTGRMSHTNLFFVCASAAELPLAPGSVNAIWSGQMLQHLPPDALASALALARRALAPGGVLVVYWVNWSLPLRLLCRLFPDRVRRTYDGVFYYRRVTGPELAGILQPHFGTSVGIRYNELLFQPDLRVTHDLPITWLDRALATIPGLNAALARQVVATVTVPPAGRQAGRSPTA